MIVRKSTASESDVKRRMVQSMKDNGGYGRRIEDQYAVGVMDMLLIPKGLPVFTAEVKIIRGTTFGPTERQYVELTRVRDAAANGGHVMPIMIGYREGVFYFHKPAQVINTHDCFSVTTSDMSFYHQLVQFYLSQRDNL